MATIKNSNLPATEAANRVDIVVAHYNEDLSWLKPEAADVIIYSKGNLPKGKHFRQIHHLPNIGRESHTFLHHIVTRYETLAPVTLFLQGSRDGAACMREHTTMSITAMKNRALTTKTGEMMVFGSQALGTVRPFQRWERADWHDDPDRIFWMKQQAVTGVEQLTADCSPGQFWARVFGYPHPPQIMFAEGALFAVRAESIRARPKEFYERLLDMFVVADHVNPEIGHFVEKFWEEIIACKVVGH
ncbi:uncharacterized protein K452DRAFT_315571 [Aplosporella prunicola CBS 121167]|uniref:Uncharacterized protein n=1 Tax=Aplosporella prunicola CBS 121167 TaxID=1176127 RepID=A0A6A6BT22_9PEZI|nr:uncharacterized protein K452DRAFT_315571 [Aplosporella prunicola CBS 121167]KAF2146394.1 hypothetical protein K452DRAFT_315571 [Aplosporella prunicola CBS 121167]